MRVAFLLSRQKRGVSPETWWMRATHSAARWAARQGWTLVAGEGLLPMDFARWSFAFHGGPVETITSHRGKDGVARRREMRARDTMVLSRAETLIAVAVALPVGLVSAIYLSEYASAKVRNVVKPLTEILAAVPTVVYGYFALLFVTPLLRKFIPGLSGFNALSAGFVMGVMIIPLVSSLSEDAMRSVPMGLREGAYALGSTRLQTAFRVVVPAALSGISAAFILAISRAIGETMIVAIAAGQQANLTFSPLVPVQTITAYIVQVSLGDTPHGTLEYQTIFACGMSLFLVTLVLNVVSYQLKKRFQEVYE